MTTIYRSGKELAAVAAVLVAVITSVISSQAAPPDLTAGGVPNENPPITLNLGPTGLRGWVYHLKADTTESRQILITAVDAGSPADGIVAIDDVILGADGTGATPASFSSDARKSLALAIADAEARSPATLKLLRWREGTTETVELLLTTLGAYSTTAPYNCPKSEKIFKNGVDYFFNNENSGLYNFGALALLAANDPLDPDNPARIGRAQAEARALVPSAEVMAQMMSNQQDTTGMITWQRGHTLIFLTEYYLVTRDSEVLPAIEAYAVNIAKNQSLFGTVGHKYADKNLDGSNNGPMGGVYGVVNTPGLFCFLGLLLARECGLTNPELGPAIERTSRFFAYYAGRGAVPYGEHEPYWQGHENNGKSGLAALCFALQEDRTEEGKFFAKMSAASSRERETGHTGAFFNYVWAPLGAAAGGEDAAAAHFSRISWYLDLARRWDGGFDYDCLNGEGPNSGSQYNNFRMSTAALLTYALPLRQLHITGRGHDSSPWLTIDDVTEALAADDYDPVSRSTNQLIEDLGSWSPKVQRLAAQELGTRNINKRQLTQITELANDPDGSSRVGACLALGHINDGDSVAARADTLAALLTDPENHVRFMAAEAMRYLPTSAKHAQLNTILAAAASTGQPLTPYDEQDPLHFAHGKLAMLLFYSGNAYGPRGVIYNDLTGVNRDLLYPAIRAVAATPAGLARSTLAKTYRDNLTKADIEAVADAIVDSVMVRSPADKMFSSGVRQGGIEALEKYGFAEGVPLAMIYMVDDERGSAYTSALGVLEDYAGGGTTVDPDPEVIAFCEALVNGAGADVAQAAQAVLDAIAADPAPTPLTPFKSIDSITLASPSLTLPSRWTFIRVASSDYARGESVFTWRKITGAGDVLFAPNGTTDSHETIVYFDGPPGQYVFEVTMSDSRGLTEVCETVAFTLYRSDGTLPVNQPPTAHPQSLTLPQATPTPITLTGTDPEGYPLVYSLAGEPAHGMLSGLLPYLVYTSDFTYSGPDSFDFQVMDSDGQVSTAAVSITVNPASAFEVAVYEPFDYPTGGLHGQSGPAEVGLTGSWNAQTTATIVPGSLGYGTLPATGNSIGDLTYAQNHFGGARAVDVSALASNGLLDDGATLWFSALVGYDTGGNVTNSRLVLALANNQFSGGNYDYWIVNEGPQLGSGVGLKLGRIDGTNGRCQAAEWRDNSYGDNMEAEFLGEWSGTGYLYSGGTHGLLVGKITWGADSDTIELYQPGTNMILPDAPISSLTTDVDQATFDTITWARGDKVVMDEIRFGATYHSVLLGNAAMTEDLTPPIPNPVGFDAPPTPASTSSVTMVAATAYDPNGVEYYFTCTAGGGGDSGWQDSPAYTDTGLTPGVQYRYTVRARDRSPAQNETTPASPASTIIPTETLVPNVVGMPRVTAEAIIAATGFTVNNVIIRSSATVPDGDVISQSPEGDSSAAAGSTIDLVVSGTPAANDYATWISGFALDPGDRGFEDDPDRDGNPNGLENFFGTDPTVFSPGLAADDWTLILTARFSFYHPLNDNPADDVSAAYIWSKDLRTFYQDGETDDEGTTVTFSQQTPVGGVVTIDAIVTGPMPTSLFVTVEASQTPP